MRFKFFTSVVLFSVLSCVLHAQTFTIGSYNIRYYNQIDSGNLWKDRAPVVTNLIRFHDFDILGLQEAMVNQLEDLKKALPEYASYGVGRIDGKDKGEFSAILYKKDKFKVLKSGDFWLSLTPEKPSLGWDAIHCERVCSWLQLQDLKTGKKFFMFNSHFDHEGQVAREESSKLLLQKVKAIAGNAPVLFTGDLNADHDNECYKILESSQILKDTFRQVKYPYLNNTSFNGFAKNPKGKRVIDHIFASKQFTAQKWGLLTDTYHGKFPSDHFPVLTVVKLN